MVFWHGCRRQLTVALLGVLAWPMPIAGRGLAFAQGDHGDHGRAGTFGTVHFETSCGQEAQRQFDQAVAMLHSFFYP